MHEIGYKNYPLKIQYITRIDSAASERKLVEIGLSEWSAAGVRYCQTEVLGMQSMRRRRHAHIHDLKSRYVENISLFHAYARKNNIWIL